MLQEARSHMLSSSQAGCIDSTCAVDLAASFDVVYSHAIPGVEEDVGRTLNHQDFFRTTIINWAVKRVS